MSNNFSPVEIDFLQVKKNVSRQGTKILHDIVHAYTTSGLDDPQSAVMFCSLLACICEGKVQGIIDETDAVVKWSLTPEYSAELDALRDTMIQAGLESGKVVKGPWT